MCDVLGANRNSYQKRQTERSEDPDHMEMIDWVKRIAASSKDSYGSRRMIVFMTNA
jgi:putative transposase